MSTEDPPTLIEQLRASDGTSAEQLVAAHYAELHAIAVRLLACERPGHTLQPTALLHELARVKGPDGGGLAR